MKTTKNLLTLAFAMFATFAFAQQSIDGSAHDFVGLAWNTTGEICITCHTPHNASATANTPLWGHDETAVASYTLYGVGSTTLNATMGQPSGTSKLCLGCHDGTVELNAFDNNGAAVATNISAAATVGGSSSLATHHPVSFEYTDLVATNDGELHVPSTTPGVAALLFGGNVECASCHDAHGGTLNTKLLVMSNANSLLCLTCHDK